MSERALPFEGIDNFRDYGGYPVSGGGRLRSAILYRSAHHCTPGEGDLDRLESLGLAALIDLRGPGERIRGPSVRPNGFIARIFEPEGDTGGVAPHIEAAVRGVANASQAADAMQAVYADMPSRPAIMSALRLYFSALAEADGPSLVHCTAGKDRTGIAAALLHRLMGVHHDDMVADYMLTNTAGKADERLTYGVAMMRRNFGAELSEESARALVTVAPRYLEAAFAAIEARFGSIEAYLRAEIGIDPAMRQALEKRLLA